MSLSCDAFLTQWINWKATLSGLFNLNLKSPTQISNLSTNLESPGEESDLIEWSSKKQVGESPRTNNEKYVIKWSTGQLIVSETLFRSWGHCNEATY